MPHCKIWFVEDSQMYFFFAAVSIARVMHVRGESRDDRISPRRSERQEVVRKGFLREWLGRWTMLALR